MEQLSTRAGAIVVSCDFVAVFFKIRVLFVGDFRLIGEPCFQGNKDGTAMDFKLFLRPVSDGR